MEVHRLHKATNAINQIFGMGLGILSCFRGIGSLRCDNEIYMRVAGPLLLKDHDSIAESTISIPSSHRSKRLEES